MEKTVKQTKTVPVKQLLADGYRKCPSVMTGGKAHFYFRRDQTTGTKYWVVWDRIDCTWHWKEETNPKWVTPTMDAWTGLTGQDDAKARETGRIFYCMGVGHGERVIVLDSDRITKEEFGERLKSTEWDEWCAVIADNGVQAHERFYAAHDQWAAHDRKLCS